MAKILLIEDDKDQVFLYQTAFKAGGYNILIATNGKDGLNLIKKECPDLLLLDLNMEEMSGEEVIKKMKENPGTKDIPIIVLTNMNENKFKERVIKLGAEFYWEKTEIMPSDVVKKTAEFLKINNGEILKQ